MKSERLHYIPVRDRKDVFGWPILGFLFKNRYALFFYRFFTLFLLMYAIVYGFLNPTEENIFTEAVFWGIFWPFFMVITLPTLGNIFCMVCPHGFLGKYISRVGLNLRPPKWLKNPYIGLVGANILAYWFILYTFPGLLKKPLITALFFLIFTLLALLLFFLFKGMAYCKYVCPIGSVNTAFARVGSLWLSTYQEECKVCRRPDCALACPYELNPSKFEKRNSMTHCTLCMECAHACDAVKLEAKKPGSSLYKEMKMPKEWEVWVYILLVGVITITMRFHHGLSRSGIGEYMPWNMLGKYVQNALALPKYVDVSGLVAMLMGLSVALLLSLGSFKLISLIFRVEYSRVFLTLGYAFAPLMIVGGLSHVLEFFFVEYYHTIVNGFSQAFHLGIHVEPLAKRGETWLMVFRVFPFLAGFWSLYILWKRLGLILDKERSKAFAIASWLPLFYLLLSAFQIWVMLNFPPHYHRH
ncbi:MAG: 4Fe-4S binding protein [Aquificaceae bacterium]|nr:4Fe-4S binding protein [Aquificaceae bacterium]